MDIDGLRVRYFSAGSGTMTTLLVHGGGSDFSEFSWRDVLPLMAETRRIIAVDLPGYGHTDYTNEIAKNPLKFHAEFLHKFTNALDLQPLNLVGISMGGAVSLLYSINHPANVQKLSLFASYGLSRKVVGGRWTYLAGHIPFVNEVIRIFLHRSRSLVRFGLKWLVAPGFKLTGELVSEAHATLKHAGMHRAWKHFQVFEIGWNGSRTCFIEQLNELRMPVLLVHGLQDRVVPAQNSRDASNQIADARLVEIEGAGHLAPREKPYEVVKILNEFLD